MQRIGFGEIVMVYTFRLGTFYSKVPWKKVYILSTHIVSQSTRLLVEELRLTEIVYRVYL